MYFLVHLKGWVLPNIFNVIGIVLKVDIRLAIEYGHNKRVVSNTAGRSIKLSNKLCFNDTNARKTLN